MPGYGAVFDILDWNSLSGTFATINLPALTGPLAWNKSQLYTTGSLAVGLAGDFDGNGKVDAGDYVVWRNGLGTTYTQNDYDVWRAHFGQSLGSGAGADGNAQVPEPTAALHLLSAVLLAVRFCKRRAMQ
jgi:hypothetical protein